MLQPGETVDTGTAGATSFSRWRYHLAAAGTQFRVEQFRFSEQGGKADEQDTVVMRLLKGTLRAVSGLIGRRSASSTEWIRRWEPSVSVARNMAPASGIRAGGNDYAGLVEVCNTAGCAMAGAGQTLQVPDANTRPRLLPGQSAQPDTGAAMPQLPTPTHTNMPDAPQQQSPQTAPTYQPPTGGPSLRGPNY